MDYKTRTIVYEYKLSDLEDEISDFILCHPSDILDMKITSLADQFYTVPNTITRLSHKLGYSGFLELKNAIKKEQALRPKQDYNQKQILLRNFELIDSEKEAEVLKIFEKCSKINVFAIGSTAYAAKIIVDNFNALDYKFIFYEYEHELAQKIKMAKNEAFFFISLSGEKEPLLALARQTREMAHPVVTLTGLSENSLSQNADIALFCYSPERIVNGSNVTDKLPLLIITDHLFYQEKRKINL